MDPVIHLVAIFICLLLSAFFSGSETALLRLRAHDVETDLHAPHGPGVTAAHELLKSTSRLLVTILLGNNIVNILGASLASAMAISLLGERRGVVVATIVMTTLILIFSEILPKAFAARNPRQMSYVVSLPLYIIHQLLRPVHYVFDSVVEPLVRRVSGGASTDPGVTAEDVLRMARRSRGGYPQGTPMAIIASVANAAEMTVAEIMVPRTEMVGYSIETPPAKILEEMLGERYTRVPIYEGSIDRVLGIVHMKDLIGLVRKEDGDLRSILKTVLRVPERKMILRLLADMQRTFSHVAIVKDEFSVTLGMVTQEDILEEIVGEIRDEFDRDELLTIRRLPDGGYRVLGRVTVLDFNRETGWEIPSEKGDTLGGLIFNHLGHAPQKRDRIVVGDYELRVVDLSGTRITEVEVAQLEPESAPDNGAPRA